MALNLGGIQVARPLIVTGEEHCFIAAEQLREVDIDLGVGACWSRRGAHFSCSHIGCSGPPGQW